MKECLITSMLLMTTKQIIVKIFEIVGGIILIGSYFFSVVHIILVFKKGKNNAS